MAIVFIDGGLGSGKSLTAVWLAYQEAQQGRQIYTNFPCTFATRVTSWAEVVRIRSGVFVWDESHLDIDGRRFMKNVAVTPWLTQTRKLGVDLLVISQDFGQVDTRLRQLTDILIRCEKVLDGGVRGTRYTAISVFRSKITARSVLWHSPELYALYDSYALVLPLDGDIPSLGALSVGG